MSTPPTVVDAETVYNRIRRVRLVPVIRVATATTALELVERLIVGGLDVIEVTTTSRRTPTCVSAPAP